MMKIEKEQLIAPEEPESIKTDEEEPKVIEEIVVEELSIDGICGVY